MSENLFRFEDFVLDRDAYQLRRGDAVVPLQRIPLELLCLLVERRGQIVTREEILERVWGKGVFVDSESSVNTAVRKLRRALSDNPETPRFVLTVPARGYRFIAELSASKSAPEISRGPQGGIVGRERELATLLGGLNQAFAGRGSLYLISGEPGVGKTRLVDEIATAAKARGIALMIGHCSEHYEAVAYLPFVEILEDFIDRSSNVDLLRTTLGDQGRELARLLPKLKNLLPELTPPLELPPAQARRHLFNCFFEFAARIAKQQTTLMIFEDLQWADDSTLSLLDHLTQRLSGLPLMVIGTYRAADTNITPALAKTLEDLQRRRLATPLTLKPLPRDEVGTMLNRLSGKSPPEALVGKIFDETGGNPFFVEELFRYLEVEARLFDSSGQFRAQLVIGDSDAPPTVRLIVARRLERLSEPTRKVLATAAVIGRAFRLEILHACREPEADPLLECIDEAEQAGFVTSTAHGNAIRFGFSHELIRQAVIGSLSAARRQSLHLEVADALARLRSGGPNAPAPERRDDHVAQIAHHYARGGNIAKAVRYSLAAIEEFTDLGSYAEAMAQFEQALELLRDFADQDRRADLELDLLVAINYALGDTKGLASREVELSTERTMLLSRRPGINWERVFWSLYLGFWVQQLRPDTRKACQIGVELLALAEARGGIGHLAEASNALNWSRMYAGDFELAAEGLDRAWEQLESLAAQTADHAPRSAEQIREAGNIRRLGSLQNNRIVSGWNLWFLGYPDRARERVGLATSIANSGSRPMLADVHGIASYIYELRREPEPMRARAETRLALSTESGYVTGRALSEIYLGWADVLGGDLEGGIARMRHYRAELKKTGSDYISDRCLAFVAFALAQLRRFDEAHRAIDEAFEFVQRTGQLYYAAELHRAKGELLRSQGASKVAAAEESFRAAIKIARKQHAKSWELRATTSLARLLTKSRKRNHVIGMLAEIYGWFTEGFDTADLKDAKALLNKLKG
jgi:adenylate cyclase